MARENKTLGQRIIISPHTRGPSVTNGGCGGHRHKKRSSQNAWGAAQMEIASRVAAVAIVLSFLVAWGWMVSLAWKKSPMLGAFTIFAGPLGPVWFFIRYP